MAVFLERSLPVTLHYNSVKENSDKVYVFIPIPHSDGKYLVGYGPRSKCSHWSVKSSTEANRLLKEKKQKGYYNVSNEGLESTKELALISRDILRVRGDLIKEVNVAFEGSSMCVDNIYPLIDASSSSRLRFEFSFVNDVFEPAPGDDGQDWSDGW